MAKKYIDADKLKESLKKHYTDITVPVITAEGGLESYFRRSEIKDIIKLIDSLQQNQPDEVLIPKWCLENIENTLRIQYNINNDAKDGETCQDRNIKESLNCVRKLLNGEEITGRERSEPLMKHPEVNLEKEIHKKVLELHTAPCYDELASFAHYFFELGQKDAANKYDEIEYNRQRAEEESLGKTLDEAAEGHVKNKYCLAKLLGAEIKEAVNDFIAGAKWQEEKDQEIIKLAEDHAFLAGADWQKAKMMKEAVEADVKLTLHDKTGDISLHTGYLPKELGIKWNDKVRIIIVKEENK